MAAESPNEDLQKKAVDEILKETNRAAARAKVGGSLSWTKPRHKGINKRFLNNTMLSTVIQNTKKTSRTCPPLLLILSNPDTVYGQVYKVSKVLPNQTIRPP